MASAMQTARSGIEGVLETNVTDIDAAWTAAANIAWPGVDFDPPTEWARPTILWGEGTLETDSSSGVNTIVGVLVVSLFDRPGSGYGVLYGYADTIRDMYDRITVGAVEFLAAGGPVEVAPDETRWLQVNISVPFIVEESS